MADDKKTLEMRVAELEDKLAQLHISEQDMATYQRVASQLGGGTGAAAPSPCLQCVQCIQPIISQCIIRCIIRPIYWADCIQQCIAGGGGAGGGGFGNLGG